MSNCCREKNELCGAIEVGGEIRGFIESEGTIFGELGVSKVLYANDHTKLRNRDVPDQHPIGAITGLQAALDTKVSFDDIALIYCGTSTEVV